MVRDVRRPKPAELVEDLRRLAFLECIDLGDDAVPLTEQLGWEAADFIDAAEKLLTRLASGDLAEEIGRLLAGDYPVIRDDMGDLD